MFLFFSTKIIAFFQISNSQLIFFQKNMLTLPQRIILREMEDNFKLQSEIITDVLSKLHKEQEGLVIDKPSKAQAKLFTDECFNLLFPTSLQKNRCYTQDEAHIYNLNNLLMMMLLPVKKDLNKTIDEISIEFLSKLPEIYRMLMKDAKAICDFDPASASIEEVIITYPGFFAICTYRLAHALKAIGVPMVPRLMTEYAHSMTGIDINPGAEIGENFFIDHGSGIVIGETCVIGNNVKIYQGVTLGAIQVKKELASTKRHPTVEENVIIYSNATILGGSTVIGRDSIIGGSVWLTSSVPANSLVYHDNKIKIKSQVKYIKVACGLIKRGTKYYLAQRAAEKTEGGLWEFPGGKIEADETPENAVVRELKEELNIDVEITHKYEPYIFSNENYNIKFYPFEVTISDNEPVLTEHQDGGWYACCEIPYLKLAPGDRKIYENIFSCSK
jgi:serine O-acetyltransferase